MANFGNLGGLSSDGDGKAAGAIIVTVISCGEGESSAGSTGSGPVALAEVAVWTVVESTEIGVLMMLTAGAASDWEPIGAGVCAVLSILGGLVEVVGA